MRVEQYGPARIFRWSLETAYRMRAEARAHLLLKFRVGRYKDAGIANSILQHQFAYFSEQLMAAIPVLASRDSLEFILTQYEESATILHGAQISDPQRRENWIRIEGDYRRAMKFIAELIALHEPTAPSKATKEQSWRAMDQALLAAETLVDTPDFMALTLGHTTSAGEAVQAAFPQAHVVKAFNTVLAQVLAKAVSGAKSLPSVLVAGNHSAANAEVVQLAKEVGFTAFDTGALTNARYLEPLAELGIQLAYAKGHGGEIGFTFAHVA